MLMHWWRLLMITLITLLWSLILNNWRAPVLGRWLLLLLLLLDRVGMSVTHPRIVEVVYSRVHMT